MPSGLLVWIEGPPLPGRGGSRHRRSRLVWREARFLRLAARALLGLTALLLLGLLPGLLLGLAAFLLLALEPRPLLLLTEPRRALGDLARDRLDDHLAGADRVVVPRDHEVHGVGIAVGVDQTDDRDLEPGGLPHGNRLGLQVGHEH